VAVPSAGPYAYQTDNHISTSSLNSYRPDACDNAQPTVLKHICLSPSRHINSTFIHHHICRSDIPTCKIKANQSRFLI